MDIVTTPGLGAVMAGIDEHERDKLLSRLFAVLTAKFEDGAAVAVDGQGRKPVEEIHDLAGELVSIGEDIVTIARAAEAIAAQ